MQWLILRTCQHAMVPNSKTNLKIQSSIHKKHIDNPKNT